MIFKKIFLITIFLGFLPFETEAATWVAIKGTSLSYDTDRVSQGEYGPRVWIKKNLNFPEDAVSQETGQHYPKGFPYTEFTYVEFGCEGRWYEILKKLNNIDNRTYDANFSYGQKMAAPDSIEENLIIQVCKLYKKSWEFWK